MCEDLVAKSLKLRAVKGQVIVFKGSFFQIRYFICAIGIFIQAIKHARERDGKRIERRDNLRQLNAPHWARKTSCFEGGRIQNRAQRNGPAHRMAQDILRQICVKAFGIFTHCNHIVLIV